MKELVLGGLAGLALGMAGQRLRLHRRGDLRRALGLLEPGLLRSLLLMLGAGTMLTALMMWLAVIDVDTVAVVPLDAGTLLGGAVFGAALGWSGLAPGTAGVLLGAGRLPEGLSAAAGCAVGILLLPRLAGVFEMIHGWIPPRAATWFRVTLEEPYLFAGGFVGQGCVGLVILAGALLIRIPGEHAPREETPVPEAALQVSDEPQEVQEDAVVVTLPGEEPVVVDTGGEENEEEKD